MLARIGQLARSVALRHRTLIALAVTRLPRQQRSVGLAPPALRKSVMRPGPAFLRSAYDVERGRRQSEPSV